MKKVVHYISAWSTGGMENVVSNVLISKYSKNYKKTLIIGELIDNYKLAILEENDIEIIILNTPKKNKIQRYLHDLRKLKDIIKNNKYEIAHIHLNNCYGLLFCKLFKMGKCKVIAHSHNTGYGGNVLLKNLVSGVLKELFGNNSYDYIMGCSEEAMDFAFGKKMSCDRSVVNNGIDINRFIFNEDVRKKLRFELGIDDNTVVLGNIGHFNYQKNQKFIIDLLEKLIMNSKRKYCTVMVGDGETKETLIDYAKERKLENKCIFIDATENIQQFYSMMDFFVFPSVFEGFGIVTVEAQVSGLQSIVSSELPDTVLITNCIEKVELDIDKWYKTIEGYNFPYTRIDHAKDIEEKGFGSDNLGSVVYGIYNNLMEGEEVS